MFPQEFHHLSHDEQCYMVEMSVGASSPHSWFYLVVEREVSQIPNVIVAEEKEEYDLRGTTMKIK
jgi:hypothetical protein